MVRDGYILIVEDDESPREPLQRTLIGEGWSVRIAATGRTALDLIEQSRPGLDACRPLSLSAAKLATHRCGPALEVGDGALELGRVGLEALDRRLELALGAAQA